ncbi:ABC transporter substrate-binding protein [Marinomonas posidonica]|uniref:ABC-type transporter, periplasmic subunit n=1 Tax=Marinomonas posidonica (strain CECT 7376 / NCIMB 14433 / IVIA-Po-181) TaxID=491952 RepID=F6CS13_MARPP|nr:iron-siderophore ABC transporter substrate-binding protein [Marinomonas posidonica]AEF56120.1 ABC-type transporter, periplasmic subunit [Marinomonas posidonica IVIA-Po-181]
MLLHWIKPSFVSIFIISLLMFPIRQISAAETETIAHAMGTTQVPVEAKRVVTLFQGATDSAVALGITPVGVVESWAQKPTYVYLREALNGVPHVGLETQPNLEAIVALKPDLIIGTKSRHEKIYGQLSKIAPTVLAENVYDFKATLALTAQSLSKGREGKRIWEDFQQRIQRFRDLIQKNVANWPLKASVLNVRVDHLRLYLQQSFSGVVLNEIGFTFPMPNKTGWGIKLKTKEALPSVNADVFFMILHSNDAAVKQNYDAWRAHPLWKILTAPRNKQVYEVDRVAWLLSGGILGANHILDQLYQIYRLPQSDQ